MDSSKTARASEVAEPKLDLTGLLGADRVLDRAGDQTRQAELIDANGSKIGNETLVNL